VTRAIRINGALTQPAQGSVLEVEPNIFLVQHEGRSYEVRLTKTEAAINGHRYRYEVEDPRQWKRSHASANPNAPAAILAPMPGKVIRILVSAGDLVTAGQGVAVVEAMKMQNELKSPRDGRVAAIKASPGQSVNAGAVLALIEAV
jgi:biotin carboxyl carrier protein